MTNCCADSGHDAKAEEQLVSELQEPQLKKQKRHGQNKHRPRAARIDFSEMLCPSLHDVRSQDKDIVSCPFGDNCRFMHDVATFMKHKPADIGDSCHVFDKYGLCPYGLACRYASSHVTKDFLNVVEEGEDWQGGVKATVCNTLSKQLQTDLRKRRVKFEQSEVFLGRLGKGRVAGGVGGEVGVVNKEEVGAGVANEKDAKEVLGDVSGCEVTREEVGVAENVDEGGGLTRDVDGRDIRLRPREKKTVDFRGKLYLAPLTTASLMLPPSQSPTVLPLSVLLYHISSLNTVFHPALSLVFLPSLSLSFPPCDSGGHLFL